MDNHLFRQQIGIPIGSDPAPFFANLFPYHYERQWLVNLKKKDLSKARKFGNTFRFIDDLCAFNDGGEFENFTGKFTQTKCSLANKTRTIKKQHL